MRHDQSPSSSSQRERLARYRKFWPITAALWISLVSALLLGKTKPALIPALIAISAGALLIRGLLKVAVLLSVSARKLFLAPGAAFDENRRLVTAGAFGDLSLSVIAGWLAIAMHGWFSP